MYVNLCFLSHPVLAGALFNLLSLFLHDLICLVSVTSMAQGTTPVLHMEPRKNLVRWTMVPGKMSGSLFYQRSYFLQ